MQRAGCRSARRVEVTGADVSAGHGELVLTVGPPANGGGCVARHEGRVVFVRYALPGERVRARIFEQRASYWHAEAVQILQPSEQRIAPLCPIAGPDGAGCCDLAFAQPAAARELKAEVVADQLGRLGGYTWAPDGGPRAEPIGSARPTGWRTRVRLAVGAEAVVGFHRYHSAELVTDLDCAQLPAGMLSGLGDRRWPPGAELTVVIDDAGDRHVVCTDPANRTRGANRTRPDRDANRVRPDRGANRARPDRARAHRLRVVEGAYFARQRVGAREWLVPVTGFWQAHRDAARVYSDLVAGWAQLTTGMTAWDLYGGAGLFAAVLADGVGPSGRVVTVDTSRAASGAARRALADTPQVHVVNDSVRRMLEAQPRRADLAVLDPPRAGAGRAVIDELAAAGVPRVIHIGCEPASFARDVGLYLGHGFGVEELRVFDSFPLTHHVECVAVFAR